MSDILFQALIPPQSSLQHDTINTFNGKTFMGSQNQNLKFSISNLSSFDANPSSVSTTFRSMNEYDFTEKLETMEDSAITTTTMFSSSSNFVSQPWQVLNTSSVMEVPNYWNWKDFEMLSADLNIPWDDTEIKP